MTNEEFSNGFDILVASYRRFRDFDKQELLDTIEFNEYEKSYYLTKAQEELVISLYNGKNVYGESFESSEEMRRYLANLVKEDSLNPIEATTGILGINSNSKFFTLPDDVWFITYESVTLGSSDDACMSGASQEVTPVKQDEYHRIKKNPFRGPNKRRALRLDLSDGVIEIVSKYNVTSYYLRYIRKIAPIILEDLPNELTIEGEGEHSECELHESLHQRILERAVTMALRSKGIAIDAFNKANK